MAACDDIYKMNFTLCVLLVYNNNGSVQTKYNQQYTKGEIHFIYHLHYLYVFGLCFKNRNH